MRQGLSNDDRADLEWLWNSADSELGVHSGLASVTAMLESGTVCTVGSSPDGLPDHAEFARVRALRVEASVRRLRDVPNGPLWQRVLYGVCGPLRRVDWGCSKLGELAPIAPYTQRAIELGEELGLTPSDALTARAHGKGATALLDTLLRQSERLLERASREYEAVRETRHAAHKRRSHEASGRHAALLRGEMLGNDATEAA